MMMMTTTTEINTIISFRWVHYLRFIMGVSFLAIFCMIKQQRRRRQQQQRLRPFKAAAAAAAAAINSDDDSTVISSKKKYYSFWQTLYKTTLKQAYLWEVPQVRFAFKGSMIHKICSSHELSYFATFFIDRRTKVSVVKSCNLVIFIVSWTVF